MKKKISPALGGVAVEDFSLFRNGWANNLAIRHSRAAGNVRQTTAQTGPTRSIIQKSGERAAVTTIRAIVARLAFPVALPMYIMTR